MRRANLIMIPKTNVPRQAGDYRPIVCYGVVYKCIAKLQCDPLKLVLPSLVDDNQAAFVEGRRIIHNVLIGQELVRLYKRKRISSRVLIKIDIKKAYGSVSLVFLQELLWELKFHQEFI